MKNFTFKKEWLDEMSQLPVDFQAAIVLAANKYAYFGIKPTDPIVAYAMRHIIAFIDRRNAADAKRNQKKDEQISKNLVDEQPKSSNTVPVQSYSESERPQDKTFPENSGLNQPEEVTTAKASSKLTLTDKRYLAIKKKVARNMRLSYEEHKIYNRFKKREQLSALNNIAG